MAFYGQNYKVMIDLIEDLTNNSPVFCDYYGGAPGLSFKNILGSVIVTPEVKALMLINKI